MTYFKKARTKTFLAALCLSASLIVPASAQEQNFLPSMTANQIAQDSTRSFDPHTGISLVTAPTFDPFEQDNTLAGTAALRSGPSAITIDGQHVNGGAYLDLKMIYTSASDDPYDVRGFEQSYFVSGDPVDRISQNLRTLDCTSNTSKVVYEDDYYNSYSRYGYLAGVHLLLPRYRGHRNYWLGSARHRPFAGWSDWRHRSGFNAYGTGSYSGFGSRARSSHYRDRNTHNTRGTRDADRRRGRTDDNNRRGTDDRDRSGIANADRNADRRERAGTERHNGRNALIGGSAQNRSYQRLRGVVRGQPLSNGRSNAESERNTDSRAANREAARNTATNSARRASVRTGRASVGGTSANRSSRSEGSRDRQNTRVRQNTSRTPTAARPAATQSRPTVSYKAKPQVRSQPKSQPISQQKSQPSSERKSTTRSKNNSSSKSRSRSRSVDRAVDRSFSKSNRRSRSMEKLNFFPMLGGYNRASTVVNTHYRCVREETITLHIPQERLDAARFDGLTLVIVDNADRDVPVYLPPNYIEGFRQAFGRSTHSQSGSYIAPSTTVVTPQPLYEPYGTQGGYPQN